MKFRGRLYSIMLYAYPRDFRRRFGREMLQLFRDREEFPLGDWVVSVLRERMESMRKLAWTAGALVAGLFVSSTFLHAYVVPTASMEKSIEVGDHILVNTRSEIRRGDLVAFRYPKDPRLTLMKRAIGLPGDRISLVDKQVFRNGQPLDEPYVQHIMPSIDARRDNLAEVVVPPGEIFLLGDNRDVSLDSRYWGPVPMKNIVGRPVLVYWSFAATTEELVGSNREYFVDVAEHFFSKTRWDRTLLRLK